MKTTQLFTATSKTIGDEIKSKSHQLLVRGGFINQEMAGIYTILPLGFKVLLKIEDTVRKEMDLIGAQEVLMPALHPKERWIQSERWDNFDGLFKLKSQWGNVEYALGPTHEEIIFPLVGKFLSSYKDLPVSVYQIQSKFRDEKRPKSGIIRGREFRMKDMYSFHENQEDLSLYYEKVKKSYLNIFKTCGIQAKITKASGGTFTKKYSHEFMAISDAGEDLIFACEKCFYAENSEISNLKENSLCPECKNKIISCKAIEIGNIFDLGQKFSKDFDIFYTDKNGDKKMPVSGCYGIGTSRLIGAIVEVNNDDKGIIWPKSVAPFQVYLIGLNKTKKETDKIYQSFLENNIEVLYDDRQDKTAGEKFADSDLIGLPFRIVVSEKTLEKQSVEFKKRKSKQTELIALKNLTERIKNEVK